MPKTRTIHTKHLGENRYRDLVVYYAAASTNYWDHSVKPKGIYFASQFYTKSGGFRRFQLSPASTGRSDSGYILVEELKNYRPSVLKAVIACVEQNADRIHALLDAGENSAVIALLRGAEQKEAA